MSAKETFTGAPGSRVGRYQIVTKLHEGELGLLSAAKIAAGEDEGKVVAVRVVEGTDEALEPLETSVGHTKGLSGEGLIGLRDVVGGDRKLAVVSDYVEGESLGALLRVASVRRTIVPTPIALRIALDLLEGLTLVHAHAEDLGDEGNVLFGGLAPGSVIIGSDGRARIMEAGISAAAARREPWSKDPKRVGYLAPELLKAAGAPGPEADIFSLGVLLWEMVQNKRLFGGLTFAAVSAKVVEQKILRADSGRPAGSSPVSGEVADLVAKALERDPKSRVASASDLVEQLRGTSAPIGEHEDVARMVEDLVGRTIAGYRSAIAKGAATEQSSPVPPSVDEIAPLDKASPERKVPKRPGPPTSDEGEAAKDDKKLPPPKAGGGTGRTPPPKPVRPPKPAAAAELDLVDEASAEEAPPEAEASDKGKRDSSPASTEPEPSTKPVADLVAAGTGEEEPAPKSGETKEAKAKPDHEAPEKDEAKKEAPEKDEAEEEAPEKDEAEEEAPEKDEAEKPAAAEAAQAEEEVALEEPPKKRGKAGVIVVVVVVLAAVLILVATQLGDGAGPSPGATTSAAVRTATPAPTPVETTAAPESTAAATATATETETPPPETTSAPTSPPSMGTGALPKGTAPAATAPATAKPPATTKPPATSKPGKGRYLPGDL